MKVHLTIGFCALAAYSFGGTLLSETFDDTVDSSGTSTLSALEGRGWVVDNASNPLGTTDWFGSNAYIAPDQSPTTNLINPGNNVSFIAANFNNTTGSNTIADYLMTPTVSLGDGSTLTFETLSDGGAPDALDVLLSTGGSSTSTSSFTRTLLQINPKLTSNGYPTVWTDYSITLSGISLGSTGRIAFEYAVPDGGPSGVNSSFVGIDNVQLVTPEPAPFAALGLGVLVLLRRRKK
jgi:MYXO-CTERM domain-containing protein